MSPRLARRNESRHEKCWQNIAGLEKMDGAGGREPVVDLVRHGYGAGCFVD